MTDSDETDSGGIKSTVEKVNRRKDDVVESVQQDLGKQRANVENKVDQLNQGTYETASTAVKEAKRSVHDLQYEIENTADGAELLVQGKISDVKRFQKELEKQIAGHDVQISLDIDYDIDGNLEINFYRNE